MIEHTNGPSVSLTMHSFRSVTPSSHQSSRTPRLLSTYNCASKVQGRSPESLIAIHHLTYGQELSPLNLALTCRLPHNPLQPAFTWLRLLDRAQTCDKRVKHTQLISYRVGVSFVSPFTLGSLQLISNRQYAYIRRSFEEEKDQGGSSSQGSFLWRWTFIG